MPGIGKLDMKVLSNWPLQTPGSVGNNALETITAVITPDLSELDSTLWGQYAYNLQQYQLIRFKGTTCTFRVQNPWYESYVTARDADGTNRGDSVSADWETLKHLRVSVGRQDKMPSPTVTFDWPMLDGVIHARTGERIINHMHVPRGVAHGSDRWWPIAQFFSENQLAHPVAPAYSAGVLTNIQCNGINEGGFNTTVPFQYYVGVGGIPLMSGGIREFTRSSNTGFNVYTEIIYHFEVKDYNPTIL